MHFKSLSEATRFDILKAASPEPWKLDIKQRSKGYTLRLVNSTFDVEDNIFRLEFITNPPPGHTRQYQIIQIENFWPFYFKNFGKVKDFSLLHEAIKQLDIKVFCSCPSWIYGGYKYMATQLDYNAGDPENRFPKIKNKNLKGSVCKHLYLTLKYLPNNITSFQRDFSKYVKSLDINKWVQFYNK